MLVVSRIFHIVIRNHLIHAIECNKQVVRNHWDHWLLRLSHSFRFRLLIKWTIHMINFLLICFRNRKRHTLFWCAHNDRSPLSFKFNAWVYIEIVYLLKSMFVLSLEKHSKYSKNIVLQLMCPIIFQLIMTLWSVLNTIIIEDFHLLFLLKQLK